MPSLCLLPLLLALAAEPAARPVGTPQLELPTWRCLGVYWVVAGDDNRNAEVRLAFRPADGEWRPGGVLFRVERGVKPGAHQPKLDVPADAWLFAASLLDLPPDTAYELRLTLVDPDGGRTEHTLRARTAAEPRVPADARVVDVPAGALLAEVDARARPGDVLRLAAGTYRGPLVVTRSGEPGRPIVWTSRGDGPAIIDAGGEARGIAVVGRHDVWFEGLAVRRAKWAIVGHESSRIVVRGCHLSQCDFGLTNTRNETDAVRGWFIADNLLEGPCTWPRSKGIEDPRGIQVTGTQHVVCHNRIRGFADGIDTFPSPRCEAIDFCYNDISECTDDGIELDYSVRNTRCFANRLVNCFDGLSVQPVYGGPVYLTRNVVYNAGMGPFKLHNSPSGAIFVHNTTVRSGPALDVSTNEKVRHCLLRNNLFVGTTSRYAFEAIPAMVDCDFDYDGFAGGPWNLWLKWNNQRYASAEEVRAKAPVYRHVVAVEPEPFAAALGPVELTRQYASANIDLRLKPTSKAVDAGVYLPGLNDGFAGRAPDLGAYEIGASLPHYGPRSAGLRPATGT